MLLAVDTSTQLWHEYIKPNAHEIRFIKGRVKFLLNGKRAGTPTFASMVVVFKNKAA